MKRLLIALAVLALAACSTNGTSSTTPTVGSRSPLLDVSSGGLNMTLYGPTPQFKQTAGQIGVAYDGKGGLWLASPTAFEHRSGSNAFVIDNGLNPANAHDTSHSIYAITPLDGYVYALGSNGADNPSMVRVASDGSRSVFPIQGLTTKIAFHAIAGGAHAIYGLQPTNSSGSSYDWNLVRISDHGVVLNTTKITSINQQYPGFNAITVNTTTGEAYVLDVYANISPTHTRIDRYSATGMLERTYDVTLPNGLFSSSMTFGSDGNLYIPNGAYQANCIFVLNVSTGTQTCDQIPTSNQVTPINAALATDGNVWFSVVYPQMLGKITPSGQISLYNLPSYYEVGFLAAAPAGATENPNSVWSAESNGGDGGFDSIRATF